MYDEAKKWHCECAVVYFLASEQKKFAVVASKKIGKAVIRNRAKRLIKAAFLNIKNELKSGSFVIITKAGINEMKFGAIEKNLRWSFRKMDILK
ncbi:ribonuclease P protein component [Campylobacter geochelonis]|uniref:ribonuclease P protein component n=1 Tax=Campylobacter geochelonis TaxID=1780362 RepID=UPI001F61BC28|nr:ribonuclease P protein component [Campylobacter geochelonis]